VDLNTDIDLILVSSPGRRRPPHTDLDAGIAGRFAAFAQKSRGLHAMRQAAPLFRPLPEKFCGLNSLLKKVPGT
jgi:hypothetical protein